MAGRRQAPATQNGGTPPGRQLATRRDQMNSVRTLLNGYKEQMGLALPKHLSADRMLRLVMTDIATTPQLLECTQSSLVGCVLQMSQLGLECGVLGQAYLIPRRNKGTLECTLIPGYKGLLKLARNSGEISTIAARVVYSRDHFKYEFGLERDVLEHKPFDPSDEQIEKGDTTRGQLKYAYAKASLKDGAIQWDVMNRAEILSIREGSPAGQKGPWVTHEDEMWKKTVLRRLCKMLPASTELQTAIALDEAVDAGLDQRIAIDVLPSAEAPAGDASPEGRDASGDTQGDEKGD